MIDIIARSDKIFLMDLHFSYIHSSGGANAIYSQLVLMLQNLECYIAERQAFQANRAKHQILS